ncbi:MAG: anthranilate phosphoribosyltransferase [Pseudomonadota bacterium]
MTVLLIDNYDSFTFNLVHMLGMAGADVKVVRNDEMSVDEAVAMKPEAIVISPGPCTPNEAGISMELIRKAAPHIPVLGVCLGHQAIGQVFGGKVIRTTPVHGKTDLIEHDGKGLFHGLNRALWATRYHSLIVEEDTLPDELQVTARTRDGLIMALSHKTHCVHGVQFHPESIATEQGAVLMQNFLRLAREEVMAPVATPPLQTGMKPFIVKASRSEPLTQDEAHAAFDMIMQGEATPAQISSFLTALRVRGETADELAGAIESVRAKCLNVEAPAGAVDIVGTGGDATHSLNISTTTALLVAACGVPVAKHGNRSVSSRSGAADVLEALGVNIELSPEAVAQSIRKTNFGFMFAPLHHQAIMQVVPVRREIGIPTLFNLMGPLANPARVKHALIGVNHERWLEPFADVFARLGGETAWIVHGSDGFDEISISAPTSIVELKNGKTRRFEVTPEDAGLQRHPSGQLQGGDAAENAGRLRALFAGEKGAYRDAVLLNAAATLIVAQRVKTLQEGVAMSQAALESGKATQTLDAIIAFSKSI